MADKGAAQGVGIGKTAFNGNLLRQPVAGFQKLARSIDARCFHPCRGCNAHFLLKNTGEMARTEAGALCEVGDRMILRRMCGNPALYLLQGGASARFCLAPPAELHLSARSFEKHHQLSRDFQCNIPAKVFFDKSERHIETGGDTGSRANRTIAHMQCIGVHMKRGIGCCERICYGPMRRHPPAVEKPGGRKKEGAAANRTKAPCREAGCPQPLLLLRGQADIGRMRATGNQHRITDCGLGIGHDAIRQQAYPGRTADRSGLGAHHLQLIFLTPSLHIRLGKDVHRSGYVQKLDARHGQQGNGSHVSLHGITDRILAEYNVFSQLLP